MNIPRVYTSANYQPDYQPETLTAAKRVPPGCMNHRSHQLGLDNGEPIIVILDALIAYAKAYRKRYERPLADDGVLGDPWLDAAKGVRALFNGDGAVAMDLDITTDSKDNGAVEAMFWAALKIAGYEEKDLCL